MAYTEKQSPQSVSIQFFLILYPATVLSCVLASVWINYCRGGEPICYHGPDELRIIACGPQNQIICLTILPLPNYEEE